ncbi:MAG TPA: helix-turn-helix domain-containing protein [Candidatus Thermoplasmatota archaeon]|nr:helix-turn-helix domain-containing protein [Candidatus Thermoplasmatota archaeon]
MDGPLRHVTFRVQHDCPLARISLEVPGVRLTVWSGHRVEVLEVEASRAVWEKVVGAARRHAVVQRVFPSATGGLIVAEITVDDRRSISRTLESHQCLWLQPLVLQDGWEHYDAIAFGPSEQDALDALAKHGTTRVVKRRTIAPEDLTASLFLSLRPVLDAPTDKQAEALVAAGKAGYYRTPRQATTAEVAAHLGLGRSAFEERLRGGENRMLKALLPLLDHRRTR